MNSHEIPWNSMNSHWIPSTPIKDMKATSHFHWAPKVRCPSITVPARRRAALMGCLSGNRLFFWGAFCRFPSWKDLKGGWFVFFGWIPIFFWFGIRFFLKIPMLYLAHSFGDGAGALRVRKIELRVWGSYSYSYTSRSTVLMLLLYFDILKLRTASGKRDSLLGCYRSLHAACCAG